MTLRTATLTSFYGEGRESEQCTVRISDGHIRLELNYGSGQPNWWEGFEKEPGHFELNCAATGGSGTLHRFSGESKFEGRWLENRGEGLWMLDLDDVDEEPGLPKLS